MLLTPVSLQIVAKFPDVTEDNIIQLGPNHVIFSDYYTFELTKHGEWARSGRHTRCSLLEHVTVCVCVCVCLYLLRARGYEAMRLPLYLARALCFARVSVRQRF